MSVINKKPLINTILASLTTEQFTTLKNLIDGQGSAPVFYSLLPYSNSLLSASNKGVKRAKLEVSADRAQNVYEGYLLYNDTYCALIAYSGEKNPELSLIVMEQVNGIWTYQINNCDLSILELRSELDDVTEAVEGEVTNLKNGTGTNAVREKMANATVNFSGRNPNAEALDSSLTATLNTGASGNQSAAFGKDTMALATASFTNGNKTVAKGEESHAEGYQSVTLGDGSHAEGSRTTAYGSQSHAEGIETIAYGINSHSEGEGTQARGINSHSEGYYTQALGNSSHSEGSNGQAKGINSHSEGVSNFIGAKESGQPGSGGDVSPSQPGTTPSAGDGSHAEGYDNFVYGYGSHAEGAQNVVEGNHAHAEGIKTTNKGEGSHTEGYLTETIGTYAHAEGQNTHASGYASHSQGNNTYAKGTCSFTGGQACEADANFATAIGLGLYTSEESSFVVGKYNESSDAIFVVGNGTDSAHRSNAFEVLANGTIKVGGQAFSGGTKLYLHKLHNPSNTIEIYLISNIQAEYTIMGTPHNTDTITLKSHEENDKSIIGFNEMTGLWITYEMGVGVGYYNLDWSNITDTVTEL